MVIKVIEVIGFHLITLITQLLNYLSQSATIYPVSGIVYDLSDQWIIEAMRWSYFSTTNESVWAPRSLSILVMSTTKASGPHT